MIRAMTANEDGTVTGYMCATDWECELGAASGGNVVYPSQADAERHLKCAKTCGIVEVRVSFSKLVLKGTDEFCAFEETETGET